MAPKCDNNFKSCPSVVLLLLYQIIMINVLPYKSVMVGGDSSGSSSSTRQLDDTENDNSNSATSSNRDISLWIDEKQVKEFSGFLKEVYAIDDGYVLPYISDINFSEYLPVIPSEVSSVNLTWKSGDTESYYYDFDQLISLNTDILHNPVISINITGKVPKKPHMFQILMTCSGNASGIASFKMGLRIVNGRGKNLPGTPLRFKLKKQCAQHGPDPECDKKCTNGGYCNKDKICECPKGYIGTTNCHSALCYPKCMHGGRCIAPGRCECINDYMGPHCEGGICRNRCLNGGKCIQKDKCSCRSGFYGPRCEHSKCSKIPCLNNAKCIGLNQCRCRPGFTGPQCGELNKLHPRKSKRKANRRHRKEQRKKFV